VSIEGKEGPGWTAGVAGLVMVIGIVVLGPVLGGPDALSSSAVTDYAKDLGGSSFLRMAPARLGCYALLTAVELVFFGGLWSFARQLAPRTVLAPIVALSSAAFVAGGMASDAFSLGQVIALHAGNGVRPDANLAVIADISSTVLLIEVNVCLAVAIAAVCVAAIRTQELPAALCWFGFLAAAAAVIPGFVPTTEPVFIVSNLLRLAFVATLSVVFIRRSVTTRESASSVSIGR
jgi:hypothetical protein